MSERKAYWPRLRSRLLPLKDLSAWVLLILAAVPMALINPAMLLTLGTWTLYGLALAGIAVMLNRLVLPQVYLNEWLMRARQGNVAAGIVVAAILMLLGIFFLGLVIWAKA